MTLFLAAIGCPDLESPPGGKVKREEHVARYECTETDVTWSVTCEGTSWVGEMKNCTPGIHVNVHFRSRNDVI